MEQTKNTRGLMPVLYGSAFLAGFNENLVNMALMAIMGEYAVDAVTAQWLVTGYMIVATIVVMCMAFFYRRFNLRTLFFSAAGFTLAGSVLGLVAPTFALLMVARLVQAVGSGLFIPLMMNTILAVTPKSKLGGAMSIGGCMITFGPALAPVVCGALVTVFGWHSVFVVPLVAMVVLAVLGLVFVRNLSTSEARLDLPSVALASVFLLTLSFGLAQITLNGLVGGISLAVAVVCAIVFVVRQLHCAYPLIDMAPMKSIRFWPATVLVVVTMSIMFSLSMLLPLYFEGALGMTAFTAGVIILIPVLVNAGCTLLSGRIMDRSGEWPLLPCGYGLGLVGTLALMVAARSLSAPAVFVGALLVYAGIGLAFSATQTAGLRTLPPQQNPFGVALMTTFVQVAACIGPAMFTGVMSSSQADALARGAMQNAAAAQGFSSAIMVASVVAGIGFVISFVYALAAHRRSQKQQTVAAGAVGSEPVAPSGQLANATLAAVMETVPYTLPTNATVYQAMQELVAHRVSGMAIVDGEGHPVGFVSDGDIMRCLANQTPVVTSAYAFIEAANNQTIDERLKELMGTSALSIATDKVVTLPLHTPLRDACQLLAQHKIKKLPVVDEGRVVGTVNRSDVLRFAMETYLANEQPAS